MRTANQLAALEVLAFETGLRHEALQTEFERRALLPKVQGPKVHALAFLSYLHWLYDELDECYSDPNRSPNLPPVELPVFNVWAADILGMPVSVYIK